MSFLLRCDLLGHIDRLFSEGIEQRLLVGINAEDLLESRHFDDVHHFFLQAKKGEVAASLLQLFRSGAEVLSHPPKRRDSNHCAAERWRVTPTDGSGRFAVVHLSFQSERNPRWPECHIYANFNELIENCMKQDHADWT